MPRGASLIGVAIWAILGVGRALAVADDERGSFLISVQIAESERHAAGSNNESWNRSVGVVVVVC